MKEVLIINQKKNKLLLITPDQFGYHSDDYYRAYYSRSDYEVYVLCYDHGKKKVELKGVNVIYAPYRINKIKREFKFHMRIKKVIINFNIDIVYTRFFISCALARILNLSSNTRWIIDVRTGAVSGSKGRKKIYNLVIKYTCKLFEKVTIISESLANDLKIKKYSIVPLGGEPMVNKDEIENLLDEMNFIYVGIFDGRNIDVLVRSYIRFYKEFSKFISTKFTIIGYSNDPNYEKDIGMLINSNSEVDINYVGRVPNMELKKYFIESNIGISYVPITPWFDVQPPTKTYEYIINGLVCVATDTSENRKVVNSLNGMLVRDDEESLYKGMCSILDNKNKYERHRIIKDSRKYSWENIYKYSVRQCLEFDDKAK